MARLSGWHSVHKLLLVIHSPRRSRALASLRIWYCDSPVADLQTLKQQGPPSLSPPPALGSAQQQQQQQPVWKLAAADVRLSPGQTEVTVSFELPLLLSCLMVEFSGFHVSVNDSAAEVLHCPRCSHVVTDKHGLCSYCR
jgi:E3 ubiquitin-protein ligase UBR4